MRAQSQRGHASVLATPLVATLITVDLLFVPRLLFLFGIPASLFIVLSSLGRVRISWNALICLLVLLSVMLGSVAFGAASGINPQPVDSLKRALQLAAILLYGLLVFDVREIEARLVTVFRVFYVYVFGAMLVFYSSPGTYEAVIVRAYPEALDELQSNLLYMRFPYIFSDPNTAAYLICFTLVAYLVLERKRRWVTVSVILASASILATQSRGAYIALFLILAHLLFRSDARVSTKLLILSCVGTAMAAFAVLYSVELELALNVVESRFGQEEELGGGRVGKYLFFLQNVNLLPIGPGYHLLRDGLEFRPHSDLIRLNLAYGILALPVFMYFVWPRHGRQALLFAVFLIPFLINTVMDDFRLFGMYLLLFTLLGQSDQRAFAEGVGRLRHPEAAVCDS